MHCHNFLLILLSCFIFLFSSCTKKEEEQSPAFTLSKLNKDVKTREEKCLAAKKGNIWENERCYNPTDAEKEEAGCRYPNQWNDTIKTCETTLMRAQRNCLVSSSGNKIFRNGECYENTDELPEKCDDIEKFWDGMQCVSKDTPPNFYRTCISKTKKFSETDSITKLKEIVGAQKNCKQSFKDIRELKEISLSNASTSSTSLDTSIFLGLDKLENLQLSGYNIDTSSSSVLNTLTSLSQISIVRGHVRSLDFNLSALKHIVLSDNPINSLNSLKNATNLISLDLSKTQVSSLILFKDLENLTEIKIAETPFEKFMLTHTLTENHCPAKEIKSPAVQTLCKELIEAIKAAEEAAARAAEEARLAAEAKAAEEAAARLAAEAKAAEEARLAAEAKAAEEAAKAAATLPPP